MALRVTVLAVIGWHSTKYSFPHFTFRLTLFTSCLISNSNTMHRLQSLPKLNRRPLKLNSTQIRRMASQTTPAATITSLDHIVLTVKSIPKATEWYVKNLGMKSEAFVSKSSPDITRYSLKFGSQKINLHEVGKVRLLGHSF